MIALNQLSMTYGQKLLFCDVSLNLTGAHAYALVGANGAGKSTLFRLITGDEVPTEGEIAFPKDATIGWLKQDQFKYEETIISDIVLQGNQLLWQAMQEKEALMTIPEWGEKEAAEYARVEEIILHQDGYTALLKIESILEGLGIPLTYHQKPLNALSGGYKLRVLLAQTLFQNPSILLLDEPTNHLDLGSIQWLEQFLKHEFQGLVLFISHDVEFIDHLADFILDIDYGEIRKYSGRYQTFLAEKALIQTQKLLEKKSAEEKIARMQGFVDRFKATASKAAQARSRMKMIEKIEIPDLINSSRIAPSFVFSIKRPSAKMVCKVEGLSHAFGDRQLFQRLNFDIRRGDKIAILGPNGKGKSTLIKVLLDVIPRQTGMITFGLETHTSYFSQDHHELLNESKPVLDWLQEAAPQASEQRIRQVLSQVLFLKEDVDKNILALSGGEAARLLLAKVMLEQPNVLFLDEPTNHMDIESIEVLSKALVHYTGTVICVSHNRFFIQQVANRIFYFSEKKGLQFFQGSYDEWVSETKH